MEPIRFVAFKGISFLSRLIRFWTRSEYSHIAFLLEEGLLIEAWKFEDGLRWGYSSFNRHALGTPYEVWSLEVTPYQALAVREFLAELAKDRTPYDLRGFLGFVFKNRDSKRKYFCSEGCARALVEAGVWPSLDTWRVHPGYFVDLLKVGGAVLEEEGLI